MTHYLVIHLNTKTGRLHQMSIVVDHNDSKEPNQHEFISSNFDDTEPYPNAIWPKTSHDDMFFGIFATTQPDMSEEISCDISRESFNPIHLFVRPKYQIIINLGSEFVETLRYFEGGNARVSVKYAEHINS